MAYQFNTTVTIYATGSVNWTNGSGSTPLFILPQEAYSSITFYTPPVLSSSLYVQANYSASYESSSAAASEWRQVVNKRTGADLILSGNRATTVDMIGAYAYRLVSTVTQSVDLTIPVTFRRQLVSVVIPTN